MEVAVKLVNPVKFVTEELARLSVDQGKRTALVYALTCKWITKTAVLAVKLVVPMKVVVLESVEIYRQTKVTVAFVTKPVLLVQTAVVDYASISKPTLKTVVPVAKSVPLDSTVVVALASISKPTLKTAVLVAKSVQLLNSVVSEYAVVMALGQMVLLPSQQPRPSITNEHPSVLAKARPLPPSAMLSEPLRLVKRYSSTKLSSLQAHRDFTSLTESRASLAQRSPLKPEQNIPTPQVAQTTEHKWYEFTNTKISR